MAELSIGEFAQASGLTPKALRLYDELGLLPPAEVDPRSGYRSYDRAQLGQARLVSWLRALGMPLARIRVVCELTPAAAAAEVTSYWRQVKADTAAREELANFLVDHLSRKDSDMSNVTADWQLRAAALDNRGLVRQSNEDAVYVGKKLFAVADGFGAQGMDRSASAVAIGALELLDQNSSIANPLKALGVAVDGARTAVRDFANSIKSRDNVGTALTAMLWCDGQFGLAHLGDSRVYLLRGGELTQITHDHTFVQSLVDDGKLTQEEAASHPNRAALLRALHGDDTTGPDLHLREAHGGDRYLLCSDGVHGVLSEEQLRKPLVSTSEPQETVDDLAVRVHDAGAPDNFACLVVDVAAQE